MEEGGAKFVPEKVKFVPGKTFFYRRVRIIHPLVNHLSQD